ncbi:FAD-dependent oxidoreductase [Flavobacteriaceae bacterium]|nr:FAD-dependent oxidoreductase [Flavobacteriaceae bacterium]
MNSKIQNKKIAIIGAGISGLTIAKKLEKLNEVTVFDKSKGIGGRMATRRVDNYHFDHGAQFFTAKSNEFKELCQKAKSDGIIEEWNCNFVEITRNQTSRRWSFGNDKAHFVAKPQMNNLCKYIAKDLNILLGKQVKSINFDNKKWSLKTIEDEIFNNFDYLILAIPSHQAINLIPKDFKYFDTISNIKMTGCFTLMIGFKEKLSIEFDAALVKESNISWISVNSSKPERPNGFSLVVNSSNKWADENIEEDLEVVKEKMITSLKEIIDFDSNNIDYQNIHRWRYANANSQKGNKSLFDPNLNLGICGDYLISGRVENAFLSGLDLYKNINNSLKNG